MTLYDVLGVQPDASADALRLAYYRRVRQYHPDSRPAGPAGSAGREDVDRLREVIEAYRVLRDPASRAAYDVSLEHPRAERVRVGYSRPAPPADRLDLLRAVGPVRRHDVPHFVDDESYRDTVVDALRRAWLAAWLR